MSPTQKLCIQIGIDSSETIKNSLIQGLDKMKKLQEEKE